MDFALREKAYCSHEEKLSCLDTVFKILRYTNIARSYGLLALEEETKAEKNPLLIKGIALITSGTDIDMVKRILRNYITFSNDEGVDLLNHLIIAEGIRLI